MKIIPEEEYNAMSDKEKKKYDKKLERQLDKEADNAVATGTQAAAFGTAAYGWFELFGSDDVDGGKKRRKSLKKKRKTKRKTNKRKSLKKRRKTKRTTK